MIRHIVVLLLGLFSMTSVEAASLEPTLKWLQKDFVDSIPFRFVGHRIVIDVEIGNAKRAFIFDTGCSQTLLFDFRDFDVIPKRWQKARDASGNISQVLQCEIPRMRIGNLVVVGAMAATSPLGGATDLIRQYGNIYGCIGSDLIAGGRLLKIDMQRRNLIVTDRPDWFRIEAKHTLSMHTKANCPMVYLPIVADIRQQPIVFDTGSMPLLSIGEELSATLAALKQGGKRSDFQLVDQVRSTHAGGIFGNADAFEQRLFLLKWLKWFDVTFRNVYAVDLGGSTRMGSQLLDYADVVLDYYRNRFSIIPHGNVEGIEVEKVYQPFSFSFHDGQYYVSHIWPHSKAYRKGVRVGDRLYAIDNDKTNIGLRLYNIEQENSRTHQYTIGKLRVGY